MKRILIISIAVALLAIATAVALTLLLRRAPEQAPEPEPVQYLIGMSQANLIEPWRITMNRDIEAAAAKHENLRVIFTDATESTQRQLEDIEMLMGYGIDLLVISPNESEALSAAIGKVHQSIPVIVLDRAVSGDAYTLFIGPNNHMIGRLAGHLVAELLGPAGGNVVEILGSEGSPPVQERSQGFRDALYGYPEIHVVQRIVADWMQDQAEDRMKEYLIIRSADIDVVFAQNDAMAYGAYIAADKLRVPGVRFVGVDGQNGDSGGKEMVRQGILEATFFCPTGGEQAIEYALRILAGEENLPQSLILDPVAIVREEQ